MIWHQPCQPIWTPPVGHLEKRHNPPAHQQSRVASFGPFQWLEQKDCPRHTWSCGHGQSAEALSEVPVWCRSFSRNVTYSSRARGNGCELHQGRFRLNFRRDFFTGHSMTWKDAPGEDDTCYLQKRPIPLLPVSLLPQPTYQPGGYNFILYTPL